MKIDFYIPFYGNDFFAACEGQSDAVTLGYLRALWYYWHHSHCEGLPTDDDFLRRLCRCELQEWTRTRGTIFGENGFFKLEDGLWHQARAREEYQIGAGCYDTRVKLAANARKHNPNNRASISPDIRTNIKLQPEPEPEPEKNTTKKAFEATPEQLRLNKLFRRKESTHWSPAELKAYRLIAPISEDDMAAVERFYQLSESDPKKGYRRHDLATLLNNFNAEVDRARNFKAPKPY